MSAIRKKYSKEFKLEAIRMYENGERPISEVEQALGITTGFLWRWKQNLKKHPKKKKPFREMGK